MLLLACQRYLKGGEGTLFIGHFTCYPRMRRASQQAAAHGSGNTFFAVYRQQPRFQL